jgi:hypothetical protein
MNTLIQIKKQFVGLLFILITPLVTFAENVPTPAEEAAQNAKIALWGEIGIGVLFAGALSAFLIYKTKHDKKLREKHIEQMKKVQAAKKRAA